MVRRSFLLGAFNWGIWLLMTVLVGSQFLGIVWDSSTKTTELHYGRDPSFGPYELGGFNDEPYADRAIVCLTQGRSYVPVQLSQALADTKLARVVNTIGTTVNAFRVVKRVNEMTLHPEVADEYTRTCDRIDYTLDAIQASCDALGFNVTRDTLRIVDGVFGNTTREIPKALPILIIPFYDNALHSAYVIPGSDGSACTFRLSGFYEYADASFGAVRGVPRQVHEANVAKWLRQPGGTWRNGWYEVPDGQRWYATMMTSEMNSAYGIVLRRFDTLTGKEFNCTGVAASQPRCAPVRIDLKWGVLTTSSAIPRQDQLFATNGSRYGLFLYDGTAVLVTKNLYSLETFISNISVFIILIRWFVSLGAMLYGYAIGVAPWQTTGVGALSSSRTFNILPIVLLPKLKLTLCAFFTVGCYFEGQQLAFSSAWYIIYPGIVEFLVFYYSLLNVIAKVTYRRMSDALFGPTLLALCVLHYFRQEIAGTSVFGLNGRLATQILSDQVAALKLTDFFTTDAALRLNGNAKLIFYTKLGLLALSLVPLLFAENMTYKNGKKQAGHTACHVEGVLALRVSNIGGLGRSRVYAASLTRRETDVRGQGRSPKELKAPLQTDLSLASVQPYNDASESEPKPKVDDTKPPQQTVSEHVVVGYEMSRLGYFVFGGQFMLSYDDWYIITSLAPLRGIEKLWNYRIIVFDVVRDDSHGAAYRIAGPPRLCRVDDPRLRAIPFYRVTVGAFH